MNRLGVFVVLMAAGASAALIFAAFYFVPGAGMGHVGVMMGQGSTGGSPLGMSGGAWALLVVFLVMAFVGAGGAAYSLSYPEIKQVPARALQPPEEKGEVGQNWEVLMRTSRAEEKKVLEVLVTHGGSYLQKFIVKESGLGKLKTHRIVTRLAERGVVSVERSGNTNEVSLAPWVRPKTIKPAGDVEASVVSSAA